MTPATMRGPQVRAASIPGLLACILGAAIVAATAAGAQSRYATEDELRELQDQMIGLGKRIDAQSGDEIVIGMEAYREVLESGTYIVGPGDTFVLLSPDLDVPVELPVTAEGGLLIPKVGRVQVGGMRLAEARAAIRGAYRSRVTEGEIGVELGRLRTFPVSVTGLVREPGVRNTSGVERVSELIRKAGGLIEGASARDILLVRGGLLRGADRTRIEAALLSGDTEGLDSRRVDLDLYEATGLSQYNPFVEDGDLIVVRPRGGTVRALEAWKRPGTYEYVDGDRIGDLVTLGLGPADQYDPDNVYLFRFVDDGKRQVTQRIDLQAVLAGEAEADLLLQPGDMLVARSLPDFQVGWTVQISGEVVYPGYYVLDEGGTHLKEMLARAGGFTERASLTLARVVRSAEAGSEQRDPEFERIRAIPPNAWSREERQYFNMKSRERRGQMVVDFVKLFETEDGDGQDILLRPGDVVYVPSSLRTVLVSGQAAFPGAIPYHEDYSVTDYIARAGGFGWRASSDVLVIKARTGERLDVADVERVEPGDRIWIKEEPVHNYWLLFNQSMQVAGQMATIVLLFVTLLK